MMVQRLRYWLKAKTRHGVHSPFVFDFIEKALRPANGLSLEERINRYFDGFLMVMIDSEELNEVVTIPEGSHPGASIILLVRNPHTTAQTTEDWKKLHQNTAVTLSIDLFSCGLLFFSPQFKEKQHFVVRYPA